MLWKNHNNIGTGAISILSTLNHCGTLSLTKCLLIMPIVMHKDCLSFLSNKKTSNNSAITLISSHPEFFVNFNDRFQGSLVISMNSIQLIVELGFANYNEEGISLTKKISIDSSFGRRAEKISKASSKIAYLLNSPAKELYLNLRVTL